MLDTLMAAGEVVWTGVEPLGERDGRVSLYLTDHLPRLRLPKMGSGTNSGDKARAAEKGPDPISGRPLDVFDYLREQGASFFTAIHQGTGGGFPQETVDALWDLVWRGLVTNDTLHALRAYVRPEEKRARRSRPAPFRSRRLVPPAAEGRWSAIDTPKPTKSSATEWGAAMAQQLLMRHGVVTRETVAAEAVAGGFAAVYQVLRAMEDAGRIRRGYFVAGLGAAQFALPAALDLLRSVRELPEAPRTVVLAATDPANPYGSIAKWPDVAGADAGRGPTRTVGALAILVDGAAAAYLRRGERELLLFVPDVEPRRSRATREVARMLRHLSARRGMLIAEINGGPAHTHAAARLFVDEGFVATALGLQARPIHDGIRIAGTSVEAEPMAEQNRMDDDPTLIGTSRPRQDEDREQEHERVRSSNDRDQRQERRGEESEHNRGYDEAVRGQQNGDIDPDSATSGVDRDDTPVE
jgi:ATP-dependent Lhr-like helicase